MSNEPYKISECPVSKILFMKKIFHVDLTCSDTRLSTQFSIKKYEENGTLHPGLGAQKRSLNFHVGLNCCIRVAWFVAHHLTPICCEDLFHLE
jgi:hypothetical protein